MSQQCCSAHEYTDTDRQTDRHTYRQTYIHTYTHTHIHTYTQTHTPRQTDRQTDTYTHTCTHTPHTHMHTHHTHTHTIAVVRYALTSFNSARRTKLESSAKTPVPCIASEMQFDNKAHHLSTQPVQVCARVRKCARACARVCVRKCVCVCLSVYVFHFPFLVWSCARGRYSVVYSIARTTKLSEG